MARAPRQNKPEEKDFSGYLEKGATDLQERFTDWLQGDSVGYNPATAKTKAEAFAEGVRLATALRMAFQASPENQEVLEARRLEKEELAKSRASTKTKRKTRKAKVEEPEEEDEPLIEEEDDGDVEEPEEDEEQDVEEEQPKPRRTRRASTTAKTAPKTTGTRAARRTRSAKKAADPAPF